MVEKNIVATIYLKNGQAVKSFTDHTITYPNVLELAKLYNDSGIDKIILLDLSNEDEEHEINIQTIKEINRNIELKTCAGGNINHIEDIKKFFYAGCLQVILNGSKKNCIELAKEASKRFGKDRILVSVDKIDFLFKNRTKMQDLFHELFVLKSSVIDTIESMTEVPYVVQMEAFDSSQLLAVLQRKKVRGISGAFLNSPQFDVMKLKSQLSAAGIKMDNFEPALKWKDLKKNEQGLIPVIVQDYRTDEVLMLAYMNEEAFDITINLGKMTYYSRSREKVWMNGMDAGNIQYVKSLTADYDYDTILAKVSEVGANNASKAAVSFSHEIVKKEYREKNPQKILEDVYAIIADRKTNPKEDSYTNYLFHKGIDKILSKCGEECTEIVIAAKSPNPEALKYEISDFLYHMMVLMVEKGVSWDEVMQELSQR